MGLFTKTALLLGALATVPSLPAEAQDSAATVTAPAGPVTAATGFADPATAQSRLEKVSDFGALDLEMALVSDFGDLDLEALLNTKVETASKKSETIQKAPALIEVLTRKQLYDLGARDLYSALTFLPGIEKIDGFAGASILIFRGMPQEQWAVRTLLLINGHPTFEPISSQYPLELIPIEAIERIEVIRGPGSVLYGNGAFAGVINVITVDHTEDGATTLARVAGGQYRTGAAGVSNFGRAGNLHWTLAASGQLTDGYPYRARREQLEDCNDVRFGIEPPVPSVCDPDVTVIDYYNNYANVYGEVGYAGLRLQVGGLMQERNKLGMTASPRFSGPDEIDYYFGDLSYRRDWDPVSIIVRAGITRDGRIADLGKFPLPNFPETHSDSLTYIYRGEAMATWHLLDTLDVDTGLSYEQYAIERYHFLHDNGEFHAIAPRFDDDLGQQAASLFGQATWRISDKWTTIFGIRGSRFQTVSTQAEVGEGGILSYNSQDEDPVLIQSPRGAVLYSPSDKVTIKALYGEAFRLPNIWETNATMPRFIASAPGIRPEIIRTAELGVDSRPLSWFSLRPSVFYSRIEDLIARRNSMTQREAEQLGTAEPGSAGGYTTNMFDYTIYGAELAVQAIINAQWSLFANGSVKKSAFELVDESFVEAAGWYERPNMAPGLFNAGVGWKPIEEVAVRPNVQYVGPRGTVPHYTLYNLVLDYMPIENVTGSLIVENILDTAYDYPEIVRRHTLTQPGGPGRSFYGRVTAEF